MKERGKAVELETATSNNFTGFNYSASSDLPCKKHPSSSSVGICAYCLKDRLIKLVCSDCGEQRLSSCSCSEVCNSYPNSLTAVEVGSVGRVSFLIENERNGNGNENENHPSQSNPRNGNGTRSEEFLFLKRSSSSCVEAKKIGGGFWRIRRFLRKKMAKECGKRSVGGCEEERIAFSVFDFMRVSRSRSLCSFRGGEGSSFRDPEDSSDFAFSSAKISDVNGGSMIESARLSCFSSEAEPRKSGFKGFPEVFPARQTEFTVSDDSAFIDLKLDLSSSTDSKTDYSVLKSSDLNLGSGGNILENGGQFGGSCRITVSDGGGGRMRKEKKGHKVWKWIIRHHPNWSRSASKRDEGHVVLKT